MLDSLKARLILWYLKGLPEDGVRRRTFIVLAKEWIGKHLKEGNMDSKQWFESKTVWVAIIGVVLGAIQPISTALGHPVTVPQWVYEVLAGTGLYALRDGQGKPLS